MWTFKRFVSDDDQAIDLMMERARQHKTLILDLRDNHGGAETTMLHLIGHFIDHPQRVGRVRMRNRTDSLVARPVGKEPFRGNLIILINSSSASAAEITTRFLQLEGYATVVGDRSAGAVMGSIYYPEEAGFVMGGKHVDYGVTISVQDIIMGDENRLENVGVTPEWIVLPTGADIAARRDPQMTKALALAGIQLDPVQAARIYKKDFATAP